jgi:hypothetical protein
LAKPQPDGYDSDVSLFLAEQRGLRLPQVKLDEPRLAGTQLALRPCNHWDSDRFSTVPSNHANLSHAVELLSAWPDAFRQVQRLLSAVYVASDRRAPPNIWGGMSGPGPLGFGTIAGTMDSPIGLAQAVVHEVAHHKLRALGIEFESASGLILNSSDEVYMSPIRYDRLRPMTAVFHAQYSFTYVSALNIKVITNSLNEQHSYCVMEFFLRHHIPKLEFGREVILRCIETDANGRRLLDGFCDWLADTIESGHELIRQLGGSPVAFVHPLSGARGNCH